MTFLLPSCTQITSLHCIGTGGAAAAAASMAASAAAARTCLGYVPSKLQSESSLGFHALLYRALHGCSAPAPEWRLLLPALLTAASAAAARAWLGYTPPELQASADAALARLQRGANAGYLSPVCADANGVKACFALC